ncbi:Aspartic peptidase [Cynara cardunculus var. scolymus]|uniref:Aspartic peptidase n=1 Tax=Cynara cardunculus var. scolymus TaxID=59895 RepID=A0A103XZV0_CYNCS|nr:Aspartic peptidase [Cynara cardunculus var. scolymus]
MPVKPGVVLLIVFLVAVTAVSVAYESRSEYSTRILTLARAFPANETVELEILKARDHVRHSRILQGFAGGVVDFNVFGTSDPYYGGLYFTKVKLGSPPREFNVQIDTGSDILWVSCSSCSGCPETSGFGFPLNFFDAPSSSTASMVSCSDSMCSSNIKTVDALCSDQGDQCGYEFQYADDSGTSGYYVTDLLYFDTVVDPSMITNSSASVTFGPHYNLDLQSISVGEQLLPIDGAVFATSDDQGTIVDTGTTLTYLVAQAFDPFVDAVSSRLTAIFPKVSLNFAGSASMILKPENYLVLGDPVKATNGVTVLGDLVLKDKIFVYDLSRKRIGWTDYDCSADVNVSIKSNKNEYVNAELNESISSSFTSLEALLMFILVASFWSLLW